MNIIRNFVIQKCNKKNDKQPDRRLSAKYGEEWVDLASGWIKKDRNGNDYVSCQMSKAWVDHTDNTKTRKAFVIVAEQDLIELHKKAGEDYVVDNEIPV